MKAKLKVVSGSAEPVKQERNIVGVIHTSGKFNPRSGLTRRYIKLENAIPALTRWMLLDGKVHDVCEIYHAITSLQIGTIKMTSRGKLITNFIWDE